MPDDNDSFYQPETLYERTAPIIDYEIDPNFPEEREDEEEREE